MKKGKNYSKAVIRSYICKHGLMLGRNRQLSIRALAAIHAGGSKYREKDNRQFGSRIWLTYMLSPGKLNLVYIYVVNLILNDQIKYVHIATWLQNLFTIIVHGFKINCLR